MSDLDRRVWEYLPARADRRRTTLPTVIAAVLCEDLGEVNAALLRLERGGHAHRGWRGSWHRGMPMPDPPDPPGSGRQGELWD